MTEALTAPNPASRSAEFDLAPADNDRLANLCGPLDENLRLVESRLGVEVRRRGSHFRILGARSAAAEGVLRELFSSLEDPELRDKVVFSIAQQRSPENRAFLLAIAKDRKESVEVRKNALFWAGQSGVPAKDLAEIYDSAESDVDLRKQVIFVLSQRRDTAAVDKLFDIARKERDPELRKQAVFWLTQTRDPRVLKLLEEIINK